MSRKLILLAALPLFIAGSALAQSADQAPAASGVETPPPPAATDTQTPGATTETDGAMPSDSTATQQPMPDDSAATAEPATDSDMMSTDGAAASGEVQILTQESADQILADDIVGMDVVDASGQKIGTVDDIVLDKSGKVTGLVLSAGEILGVGGKTVAISWEDVAAADNSESITVNLTEEQLTAAPEFQTEEQQLEEQTQNAPADPQ